MKKLTILLTALLATMTISSCDLWSEADIVNEIPNRHVTSSVSVK